MKSLTLLFVVFACVVPLTAGTICPATPGGSTIPGTTGCDIVYTWNGTAWSTTVNSSVPYEGADDQLIGVGNTGSSPVTSLTLSGGAGSGIFGFDGDGICANGYLSLSDRSTNCGTATAANGFGYGPKGVTFSGISLSTDSGTVNFAVAAGSNAFFSLEGAPNALNPPTPGGTPGIPEPSTFGLLVLGLAGLAAFGRKHLLA